MRDSKKILYELITTGWEVAKFFFGRNFQTVEQYGEFTDLANETLKKVGTQYGTISKEYNFMRRLLVAINEYCDQDWRETHTGEQLSLFGRD